MKNSNLVSEEKAEGMHEVLEGLTTILDSHNILSANFTDHTLKRKEQRHQKTTGGEDEEEQLLNPNLEVKFEVELEKTVQFIDETA